MNRRLPRQWLVQVCPCQGPLRKPPFDLHRCGPADSIIGAMVVFAKKRQKK